MCCVLCASGFTASLRQRAKTNLIQTISRGGSENDVLAAVRQTELLNPTRWPGALASPLLSDNWLMVWTTSESIAGKRRPAFLQTRTPPEQLLDVRNGRALNAETVLGFTNAVEIALEICSPMADTRSKVTSLELPAVISESPPEVARRIQGLVAAGGIDALGSVPFERPSATVQSDERQTDVQALHEELRVRMKRSG